MFEILKSADKKELTYCVFVVDAGGVPRVLCDKAENAERLAEFVKGTRGGCAVEIHQNGKTYTVCDASQNLERLFRVKLK
jgi:mevalonate pyrophosphate decarboxylase